MGSYARTLEEASSDVLCMESVCTLLFAFRNAKVLSDMNSNNTTNEGDVDMF